MATVVKGPALGSGTLTAPLGVGVWHTLRLDVNGSIANLWVDDAPAIVNFDASAWIGASGHNGVGTVLFGHYSEFSRFAIYSTQVHCGTAAPDAGAAVVSVPCSSEVGIRAGGQFDFVPLDAAACPLGSPCAGANGTFALSSNPSLCLSATGAAADDWPLVLAPCDATSHAQVFTQDYTMLYSSAIVQSASQRKVCLVAPDIGAPAMAHAKGPASTCEDFVYVGDEREIVSINAGSMCLGVC